MKKGVILFSGAVGQLPSKVSYLPHPNTGQNAPFFLDGSNVLEIQLASMPDRSWIADGEVISDGNIMIASKFDPLFLILPQLEKSTCPNLAGEGRFCQLGQCLEAFELPLNVFLQDITAVCDEKVIGDEKFHRLNKTKALSWLHNKVDKVMQHCFPNTGEFSLWTDKDKLAFAVAIIMEYLNEMWTNELLTSYELTQADVHPKKRAHTTTEQTSDPKSAGAMATPPKKSKTTTTTPQSKTAKIDTKGMKSIASFFTAKPK